MVVGGWFSRDPKGSARRSLRVAAERPSPAILTAFPGVLEGNRTARPRRAAASSAQKEKGVQSADCTPFSQTVARRRPVSVVARQVDFELREIDFLGVLVGGVVNVLPVPRVSPAGGGGVALHLPLALDAQRGVGQGVESADRDLVRAALAEAVGALLEAREARSIWVISRESSSANWEAISSLPDSKAASAASPLPVGLFWFRRSSRSSASFFRRPDNRV